MGAHARCREWHHRRSRAEDGTNEISDHRCNRQTRRAHSLSRMWAADWVVTRIEVIEWLGAALFSCLVHVRAGHPYTKPSRNILTTGHLFDLGRSHARAVLDLSFVGQ